MSLLIFENIRATPSPPALRAIHPDGTRPGSSRARFRNPPDNAAGILYSGQRAKTVKKKNTEKQEKIY